MAIVMVNIKRCDGCATCAAICPAKVFEMLNLEGHPDTPKAVPMRQQDCYGCMVCMTACPRIAIAVTM